MYSKFFLALVLISITFMASSQNENFKPGGKPIVLVYSNFHSDFVDNEAIPAFEIQRAYLGYEYNFSNEWTGKIIFDVANPGIGNLQMTAFLKNAYFQYKKNNFTAFFGMIATTQFKASEAIWGNRYIEKSFQDAYGFNASADLGFDLEYQLCSAAGVDFSVTNGEGYKKIQADNLLRPGAGLTLKPVKNILARVYADIYGDTVKQKSLAAFLAYTGKTLTVGSEFNLQTNHGMVKGENLSGVSFYANLYASQKVKFFGRFDNLISNTPGGAAQDWNIAKDGQLILAGIEYNPVKGIKLTPNFRGWNPADKSQKFVAGVYFNCELKF